MFELKQNCRYDMISLGEVMLRFDPGDCRIRTARNFRVWEGGGEYNVARGLRKCFGLNTVVLTSFADNEVGHLIEDFIMQGGVDTTQIKWVPADGIGKNVRNGLNFTEKGFGVRGALGVSDRGNTAASQLKPGDFDFDYLFGTLGIKWLHTGGIFAALSSTTAELVTEAVKKAKEYGTVVSYDLNYRPSLWKDNGGIEKAREVNREIVKYVDVCIGNEEDFSACLGLEIDGCRTDLSSISAENYGKMLGKAFEEYPNLRLAATSLRTVRSASCNDWTAVCSCGGKTYTGTEFRNLEIYDRVGGGDSFASGLIYGLISGFDPQTALNYGIAHGALAMTTPGDTSMATLRDVENLVKGKGARVVR